MGNLSQDESNKHWKRLKSIDEPFTGQIANKKQIDAIMDELYKTSKTYEHNKKTMKIINQNTKPSPIKSIFFKIRKALIFCIRCVACFVIGYIIICVVYALLH